MRLKELKNLTSKGYHESFLSNKYVFRHISVYGTYIALKMGVSANTITFVSLVFAIVGAFLQSYSGYNILFISGAFMFLYYILDMIDGEVARYNFKILNISSGKAGAYFDALVHYLFTPILFFALGLFSYNEYGGQFYLWSGLWAGMAFSSYSRSAANRVIFDVVLKSNDHNEVIKQLWSHDKINHQQASIKKKLRFIIREIFSTQGQIFTLIIFTILDYLINPGYSFRTSYLILICIIGLINFPKTSLLYFKKLKKVS